ncbi:MAG: leucine-rich repeat domain-containing protein, partial [Candidatus Thorarchaeota archaeon]
SLDLEPLRGSASLQTIDLSSNQMVDVDLSPLGTCKALRTLVLSRCGPRTVDVLALFACDHLESVLVDSSVKPRTYYLPRLTDWPLGLQQIRSRIRHVPQPRFRSGEWQRLLRHAIAFCDGISHDGERIAFQAYLLGLMGLDDLVALDINLSEYLRLLRDTSSPRAAGPTLRKHLLVELEKQVRNEGPTHFVNLSKSAGDIPDSLVAEIKALRGREMETAHVVVRGRIIDLRPLWLTYIGFRRLQRMGVGLEVSPEEWETVEKAFSALGYEIRAVKDPLKSALPKMSGGMREFLLWTAQRLVAEKEKKEGFQRPPHE